MITLYAIMADGVPIYMAENVLGYSSWDPHATKASSATLAIEDNKSGSLTFTIAKDNQTYNEIKFMKTIVEVYEYVYSDDATQYDSPSEMNIIWRGRPIDVEEDIQGNRAFECEGALAFLGDVFQNGYIIGTSTTSGVYKKEDLCKVYLDNLLNSSGNLNGTVNIDPTSSLNGCITSFGGGYNKKVDSKRQIRLGIVDVVPTTVYEHEADPEEGQEEPYYSLESDTGIAESILDRIFATLVEPNGGHLNIRHTMTGMYLDYRGDYLDKREDNIAGYGVNILDLTKTIEIHKPVTAIIPMGKTAVRQSVGVTAAESTQPEQTPEIEALGIGSIVMFVGNYHYVASTSNDGYEATPGLARITNMNASAIHPYHLIHIDDTSNVYGWVNESDIQRVEETSPAMLTMDLTESDIENVITNGATDLFNRLKEWFNKNGWNTGNYELSQEELLENAKNWMTENGFNVDDYTDDDILSMIDSMPKDRAEEDTESEEKRLYHIGIRNNPHGTGVYVVNEELYSKYGRIEEAVDFGDVDTDEELLKLAEAWFKENSFESTSFEVSMLDLGRVHGSGMKPVHLLDLIHVKSEFNDVDEYFPVTKLDIDLINPANTIITCNKRGGEDLSHRLVNDIRVQKIEKNKTAINASKINEMDGEKIIREFDKKYLPYDIDNYARYSLYSFSEEIDATNMPASMRKQVQYNINDYDTIGTNIIDVAPILSNIVSFGGSLVAGYSIPYTKSPLQSGSQPGYYRTINAIKDHTWGVSSALIGRPSTTIDYGTGSGLISTSFGNLYGQHLARTFVVPVSRLTSQIYVEALLLVTINGTTYYTNFGYNNIPMYGMTTSFYSALPHLIINGEISEYPFRYSNTEGKGFGHWTDILSAFNPSCSIKIGDQTYPDTGVIGLSIIIDKTSLVAYPCICYARNGAGGVLNGPNDLANGGYLTTFIPAYAKPEPDGAYYFSASANMLSNNMGGQPLQPTSIKNAPSRLYIFSNTFKGRDMWQALNNELKSTYKSS